MRLYLDNCCFNRPFDDQSQDRIHHETEAKLVVQRQIRDDKLELVWSDILDAGNDANPFPERREAISRWRPVAVAHMDATPAMVAAANDLLRLGIRPKDALHCACAVAAGCEYFLTTDDNLVRKARTLTTIKVVNPRQFITEVTP